MQQPQQEGRRPIRFRKGSRLELLLWTVSLLLMPIRAFALPLARCLPGQRVVGWAAGAAAAARRSACSRAQHRLLRAASAAVGDGMEGGSPVQRISVWGREAFVKRDDKVLYGVCPASNVTDVQTASIPTSTLHLLSS